MKTPAHLRSPGALRWPGVCAYCGGPGPETVDHVVPRCVYPRGTAPEEYLTVPCHAACNHAFSSAEPGFKEDVSAAGANEVAAATRASVLRDFARPEGRTRGLRLLARFEAGRICPIRSPDTVRVVRKVVRGLAFFHGLLLAVDEEDVTVTPTMYEIPPAFVPEARIREIRHPDVFECLGFVIEDLGKADAGPDDSHSFWRLRFYDRVRFDAWIRSATPRPYAGACDSG